MERGAAALRAALASSWAPYHRHNGADVLFPVLSKKWVPPLKPFRLNAYYAKPQMLFCSMTTAGAGMKMGLSASAAFYAVRMPAVSFTCSNAS